MAVNLTDPADSVNFMDNAFSLYFFILNIGFFNKICKSWRC